MSAVGRVTANASLEVLGEWDDEVVQGAAMGSDGAVLALLTPANGGGAQLVRLPAGSSQDKASLWNRVGGSARLYSSDAALAIDVIEDHQPKGLFPKWPHVVLTSVDGGMSWAKADVTQESSRSLCLASQGYWTLSERHSRLVYHSAAELR